LRDAQAFAVLVRRHQGRMLVLQRRLTRDHALAEDLCQETLLTAWNKLASFRGEGTFAAWLARLAVNTFRQHYRASRRRPEGPLDSAPEPAHEPCHETIDLQRLLAAVDRDQQVVLTLVYGCGLTIEEAAAALARPAGSVKSDLHRAKDKIRQRFGVTA
jgi:RNA polymerase sigma-70 factor (ECF subfamily)